MDLINRQDAINLLKYWSGGFDYIETETEGAIKDFQQLPSAKPSDEYKMGWDDGREALIEEMRENGRDTDIINRQDAIDAIDELKIRYFDRKVILAKAQDAVNNVPSAQKKGHWININEGKWNTCTVLKCSVCGEMDNRMYLTDNFCPNCGADMRGGTK